MSASMQDRVSNRMPEYKSDQLSGRMPDRMSDRMSIECHIKLCNVKSNVRIYVR